MHFIYINSTLKGAYAVHSLIPSVLNCKMVKMRFLALDKSLKKCPTRNSFVSLRVSFVYFFGCRHASVQVREIMR